MWYPIAQMIEMYKLGAGLELDALLAAEVLGDPKPDTITGQQFSQHNSGKLVVSPGDGWLLMEPDVPGTAAYEWQPFEFSGPGGWWTIAEHMAVNADAHPAGTNRNYIWYGGPNYISRKIEHVHPMRMGFSDTPCWIVSFAYRGLGGPLGGSTPALAVARAALWMSRMVADTLGPNRIETTRGEGGNLGTIETLEFDRAVF